MKKAKKLLEEDFNKTVIGFALPFGDFGEQRSNYPKAHEILYTLTTQMHNLVFYQFSPAKTSYFRANYNDRLADSYVIVRLSVDSLRTPEQLLNEIESSRTLTLPYVEDYRPTERWSAISGKITPDQKTLTFKNKQNEESNVRSAYLDGSYLWRDYLYSIQLNNSGASVVTLVSRLKTSTDFVACRYGRGSVKIIAVERNVQTIVKEGLLLENLTSGTNLSMSVVGSHVVCFINGREAARAEVRNMSLYGGIGIKAEGFETNDKTFVFQNILIKETNF